MKTLLFFALMFVAVEVFAANPTFKSFDTNAFTVNEPGNIIGANSSAANPNALVIQSQITSGGISLAAASNVAIFVTSANAVAKTNGTEINGTYQSLWLSSGAFLITNTAAPFDWKLYSVGGAISYGTNTVTKVIIFPNGDVTLPTVNGGTFTAQTGIFSQSGTFGGNLSVTGTINYNTLSSGGWLIQTNPQNGDLIISNSIWGATWIGFKTNTVPGFGGLTTMGGSAVVNGKLSAFNAQIVGGITNNALTASSDTQSDVNKMLVSLANALGLKTNDGVGNMGWSTAVPGTWIAAGTLPGTAFDSTVPSRTNYPFITNQNVSTMAGQVPVGNGATNSYGSPTVTMSNWFAFQMPTNSQLALTVDFGTPWTSTNLSGTITISDVANATAGIRNAKIITMYPGGSDRTVVIPVGWHTNANMTSVVSNVFDHTDFLFTCIPGKSTNCAQLDYRQ